MAIRIIEQAHFDPADYATISAAFLVDRRLRLQPIDGGIGGLGLSIESVDPPYVKDYDLTPGESPAGWPERWDMSSWGILSAVDGTARVGGAVIAWNTPEIDLLEGRKDLAILWDIRVHLNHRRAGIGSRLFSGGTEWARRKGCSQMKIETQNVNVPACSFYSGQGCRLAAINPFAYRDLPAEVQFLWLLDL